MLNSHYADSDDGETEWPLTQGDWLSYGDSQEPIPLEQEPDPEREEEIEREEQRQREFDRDSDLDLGSQMYPEPSQDIGSDQDSEQDLDLVPTQVEDEEQGLSMENQDSQQQEQKKNRSSKNVEETRGHRLPLFYQAQSEMQDLRSLRKYHMENLGQLLRRLLVRRDLVRASEIFELLFDSKDTSEEFIWKIGLEFLYSLEDYERESHGFLSWLFSKSRYHTCYSGAL
ncbi:hypothetical protein BGW42_000390 [Actinomortierella wolfii]|nr:hypothetical protein BGW42_000390 [Actinomortierella wolfii]